MGPFESKSAEILNTSSDGDYRFCRTSVESRTARQVFANESFGMADTESSHDDRLTIMVSSTLYGIEELLEQHNECATDRSIARPG